MRDERFKAAHRGGPLGLQKHRLLAVWAADCAEHVLPLFDNHCPKDNRPWQAITAARAWSQGEITVGAARAAAIAAHAAAREAAEDIAQYVARAAGHAAATAHMADHALRAAMYALQAVKTANTKQDEATAVAQALQWQKERLPAEIRELVLSTLEARY